MTLRNGLKNYKKGLDEVKWDFDGFLRQIWRKKSASGAKIAYFCRFSPKVENLVENDPQKRLEKLQNP